MQSKAGGFMSKRIREAIASGADFNEIVRLFRAEQEEQRLAEEARIEREAPRREARYSAMLRNLR
jgi:hypothetical protein